MTTQAQAPAAIRYFPSYVAAQSAASHVDVSQCQNRFQDATSKREPQVREYDKGYAVQFGDYGPFLTVDDTSQ